jgi:phage terminase large subunit
MWIEEAYEITKEEDFDTLAESMLGDCPEHLWKQITLTFNPWSDRTWIKARFFDVEDPDTLAITTNYMCNEWLSPDDRKEFERMKRNNPRRYRVAGLGDWGVVDGLVYERWKEESFTLAQLPKDAAPAFGLDFGYTNDPTALFCGFVSLEERRLYVWDELYKKGMSNKAIYTEITRMGYGKERITADSAEPKSIDELSGHGLRVTGAKKGKDSINNGIQWIQDLEIVIHPRCVNFLTEISSYQWKTDKFNKKLNEPEDDNNHLMDAMRYALERFIQKNKWLY